MPCAVSAAQGILCFRRWKAEKKLSLVVLPAAPAVGLVGGGGCGQPLADRRLKLGAGRTERRAGRAFCFAMDRAQRTVLAAFYADLCSCAVVLVSDKCNTRPGAEHGSACWGDVSALNRKYRDKHGTNLLLTKHFQIGVDGYKHKHNTNVLVIGGSGAGKTRTYAVPNVLQAGCSMVITDPKAEILRKTGAFLLAQGYEVRVFDLIDPSASFCYNPFCYVQSDKDVLQLIADLIQNTTPPNAHENDPFWSKAETALLQALMLYLIHEAPADEQNFAMVMEMIAAAEVREDDADYQSPLDIFV